MRPTAIVALAALGAGLLFGFIGRAVDSDALFLLSGFGFLTAIGAGIALIPWVRNLPWPEKMDALFPKIGKNDRLDPLTGDAR